MPFLYPTFINVGRLALKPPVFQLSGTATKPSPGGKVLSEAKRMRNGDIL